MGSNPGGQLELLTGGTTFCSARSSTTGGTKLHQIFNDRLHQVLRHQPIHGRRLHHLRPHLIHGRRHHHLRREALDLLRLLLPGGRNPLLRHFKGIQ
nr:unnamed protein product [Digitaria exilis]